MGWTGTHREKGLSHDEFFTRELLHADDTIVASHTDGGTYYAAIHRPSEGITFGLVVLYTWSPSSHWNFTYKHMSEDMGPYYFAPSKKVLDALTPTDHKIANEWRKHCAETLARTEGLDAIRRKLRDGDVVTIGLSPLRFTDGHEGHRFTLHKPPHKGSRLRLEANGKLYRISHWRRALCRVERDGQIIYDDGRLAEREAELAKANTAA